MWFFPPRNLISWGLSPPLLEEGFLKQTAQKSNLSPQNTRFAKKIPFPMKRIIRRNRRERWRKRAAHHGRDGCLNVRRTGRSTVQRTTSAEPQQGQPEPAGTADPEAAGEGAPTAAGTHRGSASTRSLQPQSVRGTPEKGRKPHRNRHAWLRH